MNCKNSAFTCAACSFCNELKGLKALREIWFCGDAVKDSANVTNCRRKRYKSLSPMTVNSMLRRTRKCATKRLTNPWDGHRHERRQQTAPPDRSDHRRPDRHDARTPLPT